MILHFPKKRVLELITHTQRHPELQPLYGQADDRPHLWLVGDHGVYLMSPSTTVLHNPEKPDLPSASKVAYAKECDPENLPFDEWWANKQDSFGGDDGVERIYIDDILMVIGSKYLAMELTPGEMGEGGTMWLVNEERIKEAHNNA